MEPFTTLSGPAAALLRPNIDTDVIVRIERLTSFERDQLGPYALEALRFRPDGSEDPDFVLNREPFRHAPILLAGPNFGCGSSREGAVSALKGRGIRCIVAPSFGDIFFANCFQNGVLAIQLSEASIEALALEAADGAPLTVDLAAQTIATAAARIPFTIERLRKEGLLDGLDEIGLTLRDDALIRAWQHEDRARRPWVWHDYPASIETGDYA